MNSVNSAGEQCVRFVIFQKYFHNLLFLVQNISQTSFPKILATLQSDFASNLTQFTNSACATHTRFENANLNGFFAPLLLRLSANNMICNFQRILWQRLGVLSTKFHQNQTKRVIVRSCDFWVKKAPLQQVHPRHYTKIFGWCNDNGPCHHKTTNIDPSPMKQKQQK